VWSTSTTTASVRAFVEKPAPGTEPSNLINAGTYVFEPSVLDRIPAGTPGLDRARHVPALVADGGLFGVATDDYWIDAGRPELYRAANLDLLDPTRGTERCDPVAPSAQVADDAIVTNASSATACVAGQQGRRWSIRWCCPMRSSATTRRSSDRW
jgi:mannose-1-phosphate guanylyltransferase